MPFLNPLQCVLIASTVLLAASNSYADANVGPSGMFHLPQDVGWVKPGCVRHSCTIYPLKSYMLGSTARTHRYRYSPKLSIETSSSGHMARAVLSNVPSLRCPAQTACFARVSARQKHIDIRVEGGGLGIEFLDVADLVLFVDRYPRYELRYMSDQGKVLVKFPSRDVGTEPYTGRH